MLSLASWATTGNSSRVLLKLPSHQIEHLPGEGASRKSEWVSLLEDALGAFQALKQACMSTTILAFANYTKEFLLETDASKEGLGVVLSQKQEDGQYHPVTYGS